MRRMVIWLGVNVCGALCACGPTVAIDDGSGTIPDAPGRPIVPPDDAGRPDIDAAVPAAILISEVRSRGVGSGTNGGSDEFIELYNPGDDAVTLDATWTIDARASDGKAYSPRWAGTGKTIPGHGHFLIVGTAYNQQPAADEFLMTGVTDASAVRLSHAGGVVDTLCYGFDATTKTALLDPSFACEGNPATNAHDNTTSSDTDVSLERAPGGAAGNGQDTNDNATDFAQLTPANPQSSMSDLTR